MNYGEIKNQPGGDTLSRTIARGQCRGSAGEVWQGPVHRDESFSSRIGLVTLPINRYSTASLDSSGLDNRETLTVKRLRAVELFCSRTGLPLPKGEWRFQSDLLPSRGMASSTADIVAALRCVADRYQYHLRPELIASILSDIERSDPVFLDTWALYLSGAQQTHRLFGSGLNLTVCFGFDKGNVHTREHPEERMLEYYESHSAEYGRSLKRVVTALEASDSTAMAAESTVSASLAQGYLPSALVADLIQDLDDLGATGVCRAHTGTLAGLLFAQRPTAGHLKELSKYYESKGTTMTACQGGSAW